MDVHLSRWVYKEAPEYAFAIGPDPGTYTLCKFGASCNGGGNLFPPHGNSMAKWRGRPSLAADRLGHVVMGLLYDTDGDDGAEGVALAVSNDGGRTYTSVVDVTDTTSDDCEAGEQDSPDISWDLTSVPPRLWVAWNNYGVVIQNERVCVRSFRFSSGTLIPVTSAHNVENAWPENGAAKIRASDQVVTVVFQHNDDLHDCLDSTTRTNAHWGSVTSFNDGDDWTYSGDIMETDDFDWCMFKNQNSFAGFERSMGEFDFEIAPDGNAYVAINGAHNETFLFMSSLRGVKPQGGQDQTWFQYCPTNLNVPWFVPSGGIASYHLNGTSSRMCDPSPFKVPDGTGVGANAGVALHPTLAVTGDSEVHLLTFESTPQANTGLHPRYRGNVMPRAYAWSTATDGGVLAQDNDASFQFNVPDTDLAPLNTTNSPADRLTLGTSLALTPSYTAQAPRCNTFPNQVVNVLAAETTAYWMKGNSSVPNRVRFLPFQLTP